VLGRCVCGWQVWLVWHANDSHGRLVIEASASAHLGEVLVERPEVVGELLELGVFA